MNREDWKKLQTRRLTSDGLISAWPCFLFSASFVGSSNAVCYVLLRNGDNSNASTQVRLGGNDKTTPFHHYDPPMYFSNGIYISGDHMEEVTLQFLPE